MKWVFAVFVPGGSVILAAVLVRWILKRHYATLAARDADRIKPFIYSPGMEKHDDSLRINSNRRRAEADARRKEANRIEAGAESDQRRKLRLA